MRRNLFFWCLVWLLMGCVRELPVLDPMTKMATAVEFSFSAPELIDVQVTTKSTMGEEPESKVFNLYVYIFNKDGNKIAGQYFDNNNYYTDLDAVTAGDRWTVVNMGTDQGASGHANGTTGKVHIKAPGDELFGCTIVAIANIDAEMVNISPERLGMVNTLEELTNVEASLNQSIVSRSGYFPMSGRLDYPLDASPLFRDGAYVFSPEYSMSLHRLDAKIQFYVMANPDSHIQSFTPLKWQVFNVPKKAFVLEKTDDATGNTNNDYFNTVATNFETQEIFNKNVYYANTQDPIVKHGFSFYMMENRKTGTPPDGGWTFPSRDVVYHEGDDKGKFCYAPAFGTYVVITGRIDIEGYTDGDDVVLPRSCDVRYVIHLGDFKGKDVYGNDVVGCDYSNFKVFRNHSYIYTLYLNGVDDIVTEAMDPLSYNEPEPGASGTIAETRDSVFLCDAHYCSHVLTFHANNIKDGMTWYVVTPFNPGGAAPHEGTEFAAEIDYRWVEFVVNDMGEDGLYSSNRQIYTTDPERLWTLPRLVRFLHDQKTLYDYEIANNVPLDERTSVFDNETAEKGGPKISVTAFVNEYYYETNPITEEYEKDLWKRFVNQPVREMHIVSGVDESKDGDSKRVESSYTIRQESIQTIFNVNNSNLNSAWGMEHTEDPYECGATIYCDNKSPFWQADEVRGNGSVSNGRLNSAQEWNLWDKNGNKNVAALDTRVFKWDNYLNLTTSDYAPILRDDNGKAGEPANENHHYRYLRWSCLSRNRDNNGNGVIDEDEIRWYMASSNQLIEIFLGEYGIDRNAHLYQRSLIEQQSTDRETWRQHVIASTCHTEKSNKSNSFARVVWAEEGLTGSNINFTNTNQGATTKFNVRCVRNLGYDPATKADITYSPIKTTEPDALILVTRLNSGYPNEVPCNRAYDKNTYYEFDCTRVNEASLRFYTDRELVSHDETHEASCLYKKFVVTSENMSIDGLTLRPEGGNIVKINEYLDKNIGKNPFCPQGYRLCNVREDAAIWAFMPSDERTKFLPKPTNSFRIMNHSRTHWSMGIHGKYFNPSQVTNKSWGWTITWEKIIMANENQSDQLTHTLRCVKDIKVN